MTEDTPGRRVPQGRRTRNGPDGLLVSRHTHAAVLAVSPRRGGGSLRASIRQNLCRTVLGNLVVEGRDVLDSAWWISVFPGLAIRLVVPSFNLFGDWLRDVLAPRLRQL